MINPAAVKLENIPDTPQVALKISLNYWMRGGNSSDL